MSPLVSGHGALVVMAPPHIRALVTPWRRRYDPHEQTIPPHITVAYPPFVRSGEWAAARHAVCRILAAFEPFEVSLAELGSFESPQAVLWLRPDDDGKLARINAALSGAFPTHMAGFSLPYVPHLTLGFFDSVAALAEARLVVAASWRPERFRVESLHYAVYQEDSIWRIDVELPLGQQPGRSAGPTQDA